MSEKNRAINFPTNDGTSVAVMDDLLLEKAFEVGQAVEVVYGPLLGVRGVLTQIDEDGRVVMRLEEWKGAYFFVTTTNIAAIQSWS